MSIQQHGQIQLNVLFVYDVAGKPIWYVLPGGAWNADFTTYSGAIYLPSSAPLNNYDAAQFKVGVPVGNISINFTSNTTATLQYVINGIPLYDNRSPAFAQSLGIDEFESMMVTLVPAYEAEGKSYLTIAMGCTGGRHRSVAVAEELAARLRARGIAVTTGHRDIAR